MRIILIAKPNNTNTGVGRYVRMLHDGLLREGIDVLQIAPSAPHPSSYGYSVLRRLGLDLRAFLLNYPVWARYPGADLYHLTSQNLASLLLFRPPNGKVFVTVHDIIPYMLRNNPTLNSYRTVADRLFDRLAMIGLRRADHLIADSHYTKQCVVEYLKMAPETIQVVHLGIDRERFRPLPVPVHIRERYRLPEGRRYVIYVGSEDPRKNAGTLFKALAAVRRELPNVELIKVGRPHFDREHRKLLLLADKLGIQSAIHFLDDVPESDLPPLYNLAEVCAMPSLYEGFGFPALEAMACGTPVVCANAASLPELVGNAAVLVNCASDSVADLVDGLNRILTDRVARDELRAAGLAQAAGFTLRETVRAVIDLYGGAQEINVSGGIARQNASSISATDTGGDTP